MVTKVTGRSRQSYTSIEDLLLHGEALDDESVEVLGYHPGTDIGGGQFYYDASRAKSDHNGGTVLSTTVPWSNTIGDYLDGVGETDPSGTGCWVRQFKGYLSVLEFGAVRDVLVDSYASFAKAISMGISVYYPDGSYYSSQTLIPQQDTVWFGDGINRTTIRGNGTDPVIERAEGTHQAFKFNFVLRDLTVDGASMTGKAVNFELLNFITIDHVKVKNANGAFTGVGISLKEVYFWVINKCYVEDVSGICIELAKGPQTGANNGSILQCELVGNNNPNCIAITGDTTQNLLVEGCDLEGSSNGYQGIALKGCEGWTINDNYIELWVDRAISMTDGGNRRITVNGSLINGGSPIIDLNTPAGVPNLNIDINKNRFPDAAASSVCVQIGNATAVSIRGNDPDSSRMTERYDRAPDEYGRIVYTAAWNPVLLGPSSATRTVISAPDAEIGDTVEASFDQLPDGRAFLTSAYVTTGGNIGFVIFNAEGINVDLSPGTVTLKVLKDK